MEADLGGQRSIAQPAGALLSAPCLSHKCLVEIETKNQVLRERITGRTTNGFTLIELSPKANPFPGGAGGNDFLECGVTEFGSPFDPHRHGTKYNQLFSDGHITAFDPIFNPTNTASGTIITNFTPKPGFRPGHNRLFPVTNFLPTPSLRGVLGLVPKPSSFVVPR
jgi:prepilin-type processing-associated H-X9-DG protein